MNQKSNENQSKEQREIFVRNLSYEVEEDELKAYFEKFGIISNVKIIKKDGRSKGIGFVEFEKHEEAQKLLDDKPELELNGRKMNINWADKNEGNKTNEKTKTIFVGNLDYEIKEEEIEEFFSECGKIESIRIAKDPSGKLKGFCHIDFQNEEDVEKALEKNGEDLKGRKIKVDKTLPRERRDKNSGRNFNRGGRGRGRDFGFRGRGRGFGRGHGGFRGRKDDRRREHY